MSTESRELPEDVQTGVLAQLAFETWRDTPIGPFPNDSHWVKWRAVVQAIQESLAHSRAQDSGGEVVCHECRLSLTGMCHKCAAEMDREMYDDFAAEQPAKGEGDAKVEKVNREMKVNYQPVNLWIGQKRIRIADDKSGDEIADRLCALWNATPKPSGPADAVLALPDLWESRAETLGSRNEYCSGQSDALYRCAISLREAIATPHTAQRHDVPGKSLPTDEDGLPIYPAHGAGAAVEAVACSHEPFQGRCIHCDVEFKGGRAVVAPREQRSEQVAVSAAVVARALVECPISLAAESRWEWIAKYINTALSKQVAGCGGVDAEKVLSAYVRICIQEHDERSTSEDRVDAMRRALSTAALSTQPLLSDHPGGVSNGDKSAMIQRGTKAISDYYYDEGGYKHFNFERAAEVVLEAALHPEQAKDGGVS